MFLSKLFPVVRIGTPQIRQTQELVSQTRRDLNTLVNSPGFQSSQNSVFGYNPLIFQDFNSNRLLDREF